MASHGHSHAGHGHSHGEAAEPAHGHAHGEGQCHAAHDAPAGAADPHAGCTSGKFDAPLASPLVSCTLDGVPCVVAPCQASPHPRSAIVICTDIFGPVLPNIQHLAKDLAEAAGVEVYIPDLCQGDALPVDFERSTLSAWFGKHGDAQTVPVLAKVLRALRAGGKERLMTLGFCWGARYAVLAAHGPHALVDAWAVAHPTKTSPSDYAAAAPVPGLFLLAETDGMFPPEALAETRELLEGKGDYEFQGPYPGTSHGFVVRGDDSVPAVAAGRAAARAAAAAFAQRQMAVWAKEGPKPHSAYGAGCADDSHGHSHGAEGGGHSHVRHLPGWPLACRPLSLSLSRARSSRTPHPSLRANTCRVGAIATAGATAMVGATPMHPLAAAATAMAARSATATATAPLARVAALALLLEASASGGGPYRHLGTLMLQ